MRYRYTEFVDDIFNEIDVESLVSRLSDFLISSGFDNPWDPQSDDDRTLQALHDAILDALLNGGGLSEDMLDRLMGEASPSDGDERHPDPWDQIDALVQRIVERLAAQGLVSVAGRPDGQPLDKPGTGVSGATRFEVTNKAIDFLGYRALRDLLGSLGRTSAGRHDTRELSTVVEAGGPPRPYEFGDTMNLDVAATVLNAIRRRHAERPAVNGERGLVVNYEDLMVTQGDYESSCAMVILLDCSHSMVL